MRTKLLIIILIASLTPLLAFNQTPDNKNWKHTGTNWFTKALNVMGVNVDKTSVDLWNKTSKDTLQAKVVLVLRPDSIYQKPGSYTSRYDFKTEPVKSELLKAYSSFGSTIKMLPLCPPEFNDSYALTDGRAIFTLCYTADSITVTGFKYSLLVAGSYTADNYNGIALYSFSNGVITKISETANDGTIWATTANTIGIKNLPSPVTIAPGYYYIAILYNSSAQTTAPTFPANSIGILINAAQGWINNSSIA
jgi:hypothetical protein